MTALTYVDHRRDPAAWATALGISREAIDIYLASDVIDLHVDSFIWTRILGYDLRRRHGSGAFGARYYSQVDLPRIREAGITGAIWVITTNPLRGGRGRVRAWRNNVKSLVSILESVPEDVAIVRTAADYARARAAGKHAAFLGVQGGNAIDAAPEELGELVVRVTLVHLSNSRLGRTSAPYGGDAGLSDAGRDYVERLDRARVLVDLAHINRRGFFDALAVHDRSLPVVVTHTGVAGVYPHWRNLDDEQLRAVADLGGTIGIMFHSPFLGGGTFGCAASKVVDHLEHVVKVVGDDYASLGSDWDGAIVTPRDMPTCLELPKLVELMLQRGWQAERIRKVLGLNWLRTLERIRP